MFLPFYLNYFRVTVWLEMKKSCFYKSFHILTVVKLSLFTCKIVDGIVSIGYDVNKT